MRVSVSMSSSGMTLALIISITTDRPKPRRIESLHARHTGDGFYTDRSMRSGIGPLAYLAEPRSVLATPTCARSTLLGVNPHESSRANTDASEVAPAVLYVEDLMRELRCGERVAYRLARELGRKIGGRRWGVLRSEFVSWLLGESR